LLIVQFEMMIADVDHSALLIRASKTVLLATQTILNVYSTQKMGAKGTRLSQVLASCYIHVLTPYYSRASSKAFADGLCRRIEQLENMLQQQSALSNVQNHEHISITSRLPEENMGFEISTNIGMSETGDSEEPPPYNHPSTEFQPLQSNSTIQELPEQDPEPPWTEPPQSKAMVRKLVPCPVRFDMSSGRVRFFGPTTGMNLLSETTMNKSLERQESHWPIALLVNDLSPEAHDYLIGLYWSCHNSVFHLIHKDAFYDDRERGGTQFYSLFLHLCMLAVGFRYSDKDRQDMQRLLPSSNAESTLHAKARSLARLELERPGGIPSIQALFLLGDLECMLGRDDTGWMYAGR
jgi:hypothetical protein